MTPQKHDSCISLSTRGRNGIYSAFDVTLCSLSGSYTHERLTFLDRRYNGLRFPILVLGLVLCFVTDSFMICSTSAFNHYRKNIQFTTKHANPWINAGRYSADSTRKKLYQEGDLPFERRKSSRSRRRNRKPWQQKSYSNNSTEIDDVESRSSSIIEKDSLLKRITQLEQLVASQTVEIRHLKQQANNFTEAAAAFSKVLDLLREESQQIDSVIIPKAPKRSSENTEKLEMKPSIESKRESETVLEYFDDAEIFGKAPSSVIDAADAAGASILAAMLGGKQRMLVDVRDAELTSDPETLVQFIELAILPVAAGLEGLKSSRNRVKIVFPTVSQLLEYRRTMALAAPEVVALSTLGFEPIEDQDNLLVIIAPTPDDDEGLQTMNQILRPSDGIDTISQPVVVLNPHMIPISGPAANYDKVYHLRLLSVQFMLGSNTPEYFEQPEEELDDQDERMTDKITREMPDNFKSPNVTNGVFRDDSKAEDEALEAAMKHAQENGMNEGITRAMVIRAYPNPWHVFVDTSPGTDTDFVIAASFDEEPSLDEVNLSIVECIEGSEREDEIVAQQMQQALEAGHLDMLKLDVMEVEDSDDKSDDDFLNDFDMYAEDSV